MSADHELQRAAIAMIAAAERGRSVLACLKKHCPYVDRQLRRDAGHPGLLALWGRCVNFDENVRQTIVHPAILRTLGDRIGIPVRGRIVHAGLEHTYGYLFSLIETPYGFKRDRWVSTDLERGLGIDLSLLSEQPSHGTLLANLTWVLGQLAFRGRSRELAALERQVAAIAPALVSYDYSALKVDRLVEEATLSGDPPREVTIVTDLVTLPHWARGDRLLVYSIASGRRAPLRLVTAFPVQPDTAARLLASGRTSGAVEVELRYNAYVTGLYGRAVPGRRRVVESAR